jgi:predicted CopG family antitoxin
MNSLQLINKIKSKSDDFSQNINELLHANQALNRIQKDLLLKQGLDVYELLLKLKTDEEAMEEKILPILPKEEPKINIEIEQPKQETAPNLNHLEKTPEIKNPEPIELIEEITATIPEPLVQAENFQEVISWADEHQESLDALVEKVSIQETITPPEVNINKATENKRIQYTVMPEMPKPNPLHTNFTEKAPSYNDKMSQTNPPVLVPLADKTIEAPIDNIKGAINLNKKIAFVKILFNENVVEYAKAIERLNNALDRTDAMRIHNELKHQHQWDNQNELVQDLERLIKRRFNA